MKLHGHDIEVGDKVWHLVHGDCQIKRIDDTSNAFTYTFYVANVKEAIWADEKELFWQPFDIPAHAYQKPKKLVEKGIVVYKRDNGSFNCTLLKYTKVAFEKQTLYGETFIRFVEETVEMVEE